MTSLAWPQHVFHTNGWKAKGSKRKALWPMGIPPKGVSHDSLLLCAHTSDHWEYLQDHRGTKGCQQVGRAIGINALDNVFS